MEIRQKSKSQIGEKEYVQWYDEKETWLDTTGMVPFLRFHAMDDFPWMRLAFSTREGGVSEGCLSSLNLGWNQGDIRENVCQNYKKACESLGVDYRRLVLSDQVHGKKIQYVGEAWCAGEQLQKKLNAVDGMLTDEPGIVLATSFADCVPLFFADVRKHMIASSHSGWKGTVQKIGQATIEKMLAFGCHREDIIAIIGPSICQDCYEVGQDVADAFYQTYPEETWPEILCKKKDITRDGQKYQLDLWAANFWQIKEAGIAPERIHISGVCTCCNHRYLFSHRATNGKRGNLNGFFWLC